VDHQKLEEALLIAGSYSNVRYTFTDTMAALTQQYCQPHQLALQQIDELMDGPNLNSGDVKSSQTLAQNVCPLVGLLEQLGTRGEVELECGSHVAKGQPENLPCETIRQEAQVLQYPSSYLLSVNRL